MEINELSKLDPEIKVALIKKINVETQLLKAQTSKTIAEAKEISIGNAESIIEMLYEYDDIIDEDNDGLIKFMLPDNDEFPVAEKHFLLSELKEIEKLLNMTESEAVG